MGTVHPRPPFTAATAGRRLSFTLFYQEIALIKRGRCKFTAPFDGGKSSIGQACQTATIPSAAGRCLAPRPARHLPSAAQTKKGRPAVRPRALP
ncbi:hypothetical protein HMPREF0262_00248 [Clostridium sp. ATCC 29733]|nr:hypothetical protein HMPREF0262_00248 [Clostridium sp. ATCC 29733]